MRKTQSLPPDWERRVRALIFRNDSHQKNMLRLLGKTEVEDAARHLWRVAKLNSKLRNALYVCKIRDEIDRHIHKSLLILSNARNPGFKRPRTSKALRNVADILERVRDDGFFQEGQSRAEIECAIQAYRGFAKSAPRTKPRDIEQRFALIMLRSEFRKVFGKPVNYAVALLMQAEFGGMWTEKEVRERSREWGI